ncbi:MAG: hypothetical protein QOD42_2771 [Sphingomonadales bacterium]|nr:hypothetical protein [Sphingomonadales bacterium]
MRRVLFAGLALGLAAPALAAQPPAAGPSSPATAAAPDPGRLAAAERLVALIMPEDAVRRMLSEGLPGMDMAMDMSPEEIGLSAEMGASEADRGRSLAELGSARDPHFRERMQIMRRVSGEVMGEMMGEMQPLIARACAAYFARRLTLAELDELVGLFSTPAGRKFSEAWLGMAQDRAFAETLREMVPRLVQMGARIDERVRAATAHLPPPPAPLDAAPEEAPEAEADAD